MLSLEEAQQRIVDDLAPLGLETTGLLDAHGRVAAETVCATRALPAFDNSAMDGYAVRAEDLRGASSEAPTRLRLRETIAAGSPSTGTVTPGSAMRIFTGAPVPQGADAVVMQEDTRVEGDTVCIYATATPAQHVRAAGNDIASGDELITPGRVIGAGEVAALATQGRSFVRVHRRPRVAIVPTGNELVEIDLPVGTGQITNSNSIMLAAQVRAAGAVAVRVPPVRDNTDAMAPVLREAATGCDLVLTSGGVSVGDFDLVRSVLEDLGELLFWRVAIKPGKPLAFGKLAGTPVLGLPGNPASSMVCFALFGRPALRKLSGAFAPLQRRHRARLTDPVRRNRSRREFVRARLETRGDSELWARPLSQQGSGQISSMLAADALLDIAPTEQVGNDTVAAASPVSVILLG
jgi:molybdopterin molybdotransferase